MKKNISFNYSIWISILRIVATLLIFYFHFLGLFGLDNRGADILGISIFCFISGYLVYPVKEPVRKWLLKKYLQIIIPYWLVISFVIIINFIVEYKPKELYEILIIFFTGGMFVHDPLYVISWYITFILCLYSIVAICNTCKNNSIKFVVFLASIIFYIFVIKQPHIYFISFVAGYLLKYITNKAHPQKKVIQDNLHPRFHKILFFLQNRCYSFFLIHGGILLLFVKVIQLSQEKCLMISLFITSILAHIHYAISITANDGWILSTG